MHDYRKITFWEAALQIAKHFDTAVRVYKAHQRQFSVSALKRKYRERRAQSALRAARYWQTADVRSFRKRTLCRFSMI